MRTHEEETITVKNIQSLHLRLCHRPHLSKIFVLYALVQGAWGVSLFTEQSWCRKQVVVMPFTLKGFKFTRLQYKHRSRSVLSTEVCLHLMTHSVP